MSSAEEPSAAPEPGDLLADKYRVERVVGVGGMGVVVAAVHVQLEERVALKLMKREVMNPDTIARFLREARSAAKIKSEHVARVNDVGVLAGGTPFMVMELLEGEDLGHRVRERGPLPPEEAVEYVLQACEAVGEAHVLGIVHRDLKPSNLFLARRPGGRRIVKVVDFGISKQIAAEGMPTLEEGAKTRTSAWLGSPLYMSPEQMRSAKDVDARADIWSLGLILYELCSGHVPFDAPSLVELCGRVLHDQPTPLADWMAKAPPPELVQAIAGCLQKDRDQRFQDVGELALALVDVAPPGSAERIDRIVSIVHGSAWTPPARATRSPPPVEEDAAPMPLVRPQAVEYEVEVGTTAPGATPARRRSHTPLVLLLLLLVVAGGSGAYLRQRAGQWPFAAVVAARAPAPPLATEPSPPVVPPQVTAPASAAPVAEVEPVVATSAPAVASSASSSATSKAPGARVGSKRAPAATTVVTAPVEMPAPPPMPPRPEVLSETCFETLPDGTRKTIPCP